MTAPVRGALWMIAAAAWFSLMTVSVRELAPIAASQVVFLRSLFGLFMVLPWLKRPEAGIFRHPRLPLFGLRAIFSYGAMLAWFYAIQHAVLADAVALQFTLPLFTILFAIIIFKEPVGPRRWAATLIGFAGALIIVRPGFAELDPATLVVILSAALYAASNMVIKVLSRTETAATIVFYLHILTLPLALIGAIPAWIWPESKDWAWILVLAASGSLAHYCFTRSLATADTAVVMPFDYLRLPMLAVAAYILYREIPEIWSWLGAAVICASTFYLLRRESRLARERALASAQAASSQGENGRGKEGRKEERG